MMAWLTGTAAFIAVLSFIKPNHFDTIFAALLAATFGVVWQLFPDMDQRLLAIRTCSGTAFVLLNCVLLIGPWARFTKIIEKLYRHRRHMGVVTFLLGLAHFSLLFGPYFDYSFENAFMALFTFFGFTALLVMFFLALTSWDWCQKHIGSKQWKIIHAVSLLIYVASAGYAVWVNTSKGLPIDTYFYIAVPAFIIFWILVAPWGLAPKFIRYVMGWKQFHVLIYIAYVSVIIHGWEAASMIMPEWMKVVFWGLPAFVAASHSVGLLRKWGQENALKEVEKNAETLHEGGFDFICAGGTDDFKENLGRKILVNGQPVTVFKLKDSFYAWYAVCPHQKGPLERGKIVKGYLTCPWHQWQFSVKDGMAPPGYKDCVPYYPTLVKNSKVYVRKTPKSGQ